MQAKVTKLSTLLAEALQCIFWQHLYSHFIKLYKCHFSVHCVLGFSHHDNIFTTTSQINYSSPHGDNLQRDLPMFGGLHTDHTVDPAQYACLLFLSNLKPSIFPSQLCPLLQWENCILTLFTVLIFQGSHLQIGLPPMQMSMTDR
jgi:hypothetical protein